MSWYHTVDPRRINDRRVRGLSLLARVLWAHLLVGEAATKVPGLARGGPAGLAEVLDQRAEDVERALAELERAQAVEVDRAERVIRLIDVAADHRAAAGSLQTVRHWLTHARDLPRSAVAGRHFADLAGLCRERGLGGAAEEWDRLSREHDPGGATSAPDVPKDMSDGPAGRESVGVRALPEAPPMPLPGALDQRSDRIGIEIGDRDNPPTPQGGEEGRTRVDEALEVLRTGARDLGTSGPSGLTGAERRRLRRSGRDDPGLLEELPELARRQLERVRRDLAAGRDTRHLLTIGDVLREAPRLRGATHLDGPARAPPGAARPGMFRSVDHEEKHA